MNLHAASSYAKHLLRARSTAGHGVHSPFMFGFITEVIGGEPDMGIIKEVESLRKEMLADSRMLKMLDLGAGSAVMKGGERKVREIAAASALPAKEAALLSRIAGSLDMIKPWDRVAFQRQQNWLTKSPLQGNEQESGVDHGGANYGDPGPAEGERGGILPGGIRKGGVSSGRTESHVILELGTSLGISTLALALGAPERMVISVEGCPELAAIARENLRSHGANNVEVLSMEFSVALRHLRTLGTRVELAFIDGNHRGRALQAYVNQIREMGEEMIMVADDIRMNSDMSMAWKLLSTGRFAGSGELASGRPGQGGNPTGKTNNSDTAGETPYISAADAGNSGIAAADAGNTNLTPVSAVSSGSSATDGNRTEKEPEPGYPYRMHPAPVSLETFRFGMLFFLRNITPGHYRVRC